MQLLARSLPVFLGRPASELEIIVVNNDPAQDVPGWLESTFGAEDRARVRVIEMGFDSGFARAMNRGISASSGEFLLICNADLFPSSSYVDEMLHFFAAHAKAGLATGKILRYDLSSDRPLDIIDTTGLVLRRNRRFIARGEGERDAGQYGQVEEVIGVDGAALFARRAALVSIMIGGECFDESFFMYKEDWDLSWRVRRLGMLVCPFRCRLSWPHEQGPRWPRLLLRGQALPREREGEASAGPFSLAQEPVAHAGQK
jgi:GT2 family glycosyltransferase